MILKHPCGCVEYEHGNAYCSRHQAMTSAQRAFENIRERSTTRRHQDGGAEWFCPSCERDVMFEQHKPDCFWIKSNA